MRNLIQKIRQAIEIIFGLRAASESLKGYLNLEELLKVLATAVTAGGGLLGALEILQAAVPRVVEAPYVALVGAILAAVVQVVRFLRHGRKP